MDNLPFHIIRHHIIPFLTSSNELTKLQKLSKKYSYIKTHSYENLECYSCKSNRFSTHSNPNMCYITGCMSTDIIHPYVKYWTRDNMPLCSMGCAMNIWNKML